MLVHARMFQLSTQKGRALIYRQLSPARATDTFFGAARFAGRAVSDPAARIVPYCTARAVPSTKKKKGELPSTGSLQQRNEKRAKFLRNNGQSDHRPTKCDRPSCPRVNNKHAPKSNRKRNEYIRAYRERDEERESERERERDLTYFQNSYV
jgi:hypothetical protein